MSICVPKPKAMPWVSASVVGAIVSPPPRRARPWTCKVPPRKSVPVHTPAVTASQFAKSAVSDHSCDPVVFSGKLRLIMSDRPGRETSDS